MDSQRVEHDLVNKTTTTMSFLNSFLLKEMRERKKKDAIFSCDVFWYM